MPLYEMIVVSKISEAQNIVGFLKSFVNTVHNGGGVLRNVKNIGDRIAAREYKAKDGSKHSFVRFLALEFDADPVTMKVLEVQTKAHADNMSVIIHKLNMNDYYKRMVDTEYFKKFENTEVDQEKQNNFLIKNTAKEIVKQIKDEDLSEDDIFLKFGIRTEVAKGKKI